MSPRIFLQCAAVAQNLHLRLYTSQPLWSMSPFADTNILPSRDAHHLHHHYPHHPFFAEECDRIGVLFWSELCFWGTGGLKQEGYWTSSAYPVREEDQKPFEESCKRALEEMILVNRNHPSIIIWSVCNEPFFSDEEVLPKARKLVKQLVEQVHAQFHRAAIGLHTMWNEHFGISVAEYMVCEAHSRSLLWTMP